MKKCVSVNSLLLAVFCWCKAQTFYNGHFEIHNLDACEYNIPDSVFNTKMQNVHVFGKRRTSGGFVGENDIQTLIVM